MTWNRPLRIFIYSISLILLVLYGRYFHPFVTLQMCLANPEEYDGFTIDVGNEAVIGEVFQDGFSIEQMGQRVRVFGPTEVARPGEFITLNAVFHREGFLVVKEMRVAERRRTKIWLSVFPVLVICFIFLRRFRLDYRMMYFMKR